MYMINIISFRCRVYQTIAIGMFGLLQAKGRPIISICSKFLNIPHDSTEQHKKLMTQYYKAAANVQHYKLNFYNKSRPDKKKPSPRRRRTKPWRKYQYSSVRQWAESRGQGWWGRCEGRSQDPEILKQSRDRYRNHVTIQRLSRDS